MNSPVFIRAKVYTRYLIFVLLMIFASNAFAQWRVDFSRRTKSEKPNNESDVGIQTPEVEVVDVSGKDTGSSEKAPTRLPPKTFVTNDPADDVHADSSLPRAVRPLKEVAVPVSNAQDLVVLNTERGFVPSSLRLRMGTQYRLHVVNINEKEKNVSFVMDAFAEHHATFFGRAKVIEIVPQKDGVFEFQCPETAMSGRLVVLPSNTTSDTENASRLPANRDEW